LAGICKYGNAAVLLFFAVYFFLIPFGIVIYELSDANIRSDGIPRMAVRLHRNLTPKYERWARGRVASGKAAGLAVSNISGTEWPLFGSVFYLWATESLQEAWESGGGAARAPRDYARGAIEAAKDLVIDPGHAAWVRKHWGEDYLRRENVFYRMLVIAALTSHYKLTGDGRHLPMLREQAVGLAKELDESPHGILDDYPDQCYPTDVLAAIACIRRADAVLGTDHSAFVRRALRGFRGALLDGRGLPPYSSDSKTGAVRIYTRGCGNSYACLFAPEIWPEQAAEWYALYEKHFFQRKWTAVGFREHPKDLPGRDWSSMDVDSGPILAGHGFAACAFGIGAARVNGRFDHAYPLTAEMLAVSMPLLDGTLAGPRILSNAIDAPYLGEAAILYMLTRRPAANVKITTGGSIPTFVYIVLALYLGIGALLILLNVRNIRRYRRRRDRSIPRAEIQFAIWTVLAVGGAVIALFWSVAAGIIMLLCAQFLPRIKRIKKTADVNKNVPPHSS
jgi:hypothetical protein